MKNIIVVGKDQSVVRLSVDTVKQTAKLTEIAGVVSGNVTGATRINCLSAITDIMEMLKDGLADETEPIVIYTVGLVVDAINNGTFKYWFLNDNKKANGDNVNDTEIEKWAKFVEMYADPEMFCKVIFKDVATKVLPRNPKYAVSMQDKALASYIDAAWKKVNASAGIIVVEEEAEGGEL
jgi:hypothetical protein